MNQIDAEYDNKIENLKAQIEKLSLWLWGNRIKEKNITSWLENFENTDIKNEKELVLNLLSQFMFYDLREIRQALKSIFKDLYLSTYIVSFRKLTNSYNMKDYHLHINQQLERTRFLGVGNPSESSSLLLYFFRQKNNISKNYFAESCQFLLEDKSNNKIENLVYIDDLSGSGGQVITNLSKIIQRIRDLREKENIPIHISYFTIFATTEALEFLKNFKDEKERNLFDKVNSIFELDSTYKVFSDNSRYLANATDKINLKDLCISKYFEKCAIEDIKAPGECGYGDTQLMLGFFYNIPNNTLPIFWSDNPPKWSALFKRYNKKYRLGI